MSDATAESTLEWVNRRHGTGLKLGNPLPGGLQGGARRLIRPDGSQAVLKISTNRGIVARLDVSAASIRRLREHGYPTPAWHLWGVTDAGVAFIIEDLTAGLSSTWRTVQLGKVCAAIELHGLGGGEAESWSSWVESVVFDVDGPRRHLSGLPGGAALVAHFGDVLAGHGPCSLPSGDLVHGDMNTSNVLLSARKISAIVDIEAIGSGTRTVDYAWLLREGFTVDAPPADLEMLRAAACRASSPAALAVCAAATAFDIILFWAGRSRDGVLAADSFTPLHAFADFVRPYTRSAAREDVSGGEGAVGHADVRKSPDAGWGSRDVSEARWGPARLST